MPTAKKKPAGPVNIELTTRQFRNLVEPVMPLAGNDDMLPVLTTLLIRANATTITATATDRFRVGISRIPNTGATDTLPAAGVEFMIRTADVKRVLTVFKGSRYDDPALNFTYYPAGTDSAPVVEVNSQAGFDGLAGATLRLTVPDGEFPKVNQIFTELLEDTDARVDSFGVNAAFLADFKAAVRDGHPLTVRPGANDRKGVIVACGDHFIGVLMTRRLILESGHDPVAELAKSWSDILPAKTEAAA